MAMRVSARYFSLLSKPREKPAFAHELQKAMGKLDIEGKPGGLLDPIKIDNPGRLAVKMVAFMCLSFFQPFVVTYLHLRGG
ncbi:unnamed protein product [Schistosoma rodhaini]|uniref:Cytochrome c oxidase polypeptide VIIc n=2 Tax=Schistosoma TaxID=6181 RepID=A0A3Q0KU78_SCHMA|nr:unnamed protein product [Schistosoma rodhaini]CAH8674996.1 unnamed protein product [Schistosoma rodhaini]